MGKKLRPFEFYGYDGDNTMYEAHSTDILKHIDVFAISKVKEQQNRKYIKLDEDEESQEGEPADDDNNG